MLLCSDDITTKNWNTLWSLTKLCPIISFFLTYMTYIVHMWRTCIVYIIYAIYIVYIWHTLCTYGMLCVIHVWYIIWYMYSLLTNQLPSFSFIQGKKSSDQLNCQNWFTVCAKYKFICWSFVDIFSLQCTMILQF
jgi:hypothetical protein